MANKLTTSEFIKKAILVHGTKYNYSNVIYTKAKEKVEIICPKHGTFLQTPTAHLRGQGCPECGKDTIRNVRLSDTDSFIKKAVKIHGNIYDYSLTKYVLAIDLVEIKCPIHGVFKISPHNHLSGYGCQKCAIENRTMLKRTNINDFLQLANVVHGNKYDYSKVKYTSLHDDITIVCPVHGEFNQRGTHHLNGCGCPKCNQSHLEREVKQFLDSINILYEEQKSFKWLGLLTLDFYIPKIKTAIECQGRQHFKPIDFFGGEDAYKAQMERDNRKKQLCKEHEIKIIYYSNKENIKGLMNVPKNVIIGIDNLNDFLYNGNKFDKNKMTYNNPSVNFVSRTANNNGISDFVDNNGTIPYEAGCITLAFGGSIGSCFLQEQPFYTGQNVGVIRFPESVSNKAKIYIANNLSCHCKNNYVAFGDEINKHFKTDLTFPLPVDSNGNPDFDYMDRYIKAMEKVVIADVVDYKNKLIEETKRVVGD